MTAKKCSQCGVKKSSAQPSASGKVQHVTNSYVNPGTSMESRDRVSPYETDPRKTSNMWRKRLPSFRNKPCLWGYVPLLRIREKELKRAITRSRPLGNQLDTCKSAVERAMTRLADCALKTRRSAMCPTKCRHRSPHKNARNLKSSKHVSSAHPLLLPRSDNSLTVLSCAVSRVPHDLKSAPTIPESWLVCAEQEMTTHLSKLSSLASKMGVSHAEAGSKHAAGSSVGGDLGAKAHFRNIARRHNVRSFSASFSRYQLLSRSIFL